MTPSLLPIEAIPALLERLRAATNGLDDETLGRVIACACGRPFNRVDVSCGDDGSDEFNLYCYPEAVSQYSEYRHRCPDVSLDAALALVERRYPGWSGDLLFEALGALSTDGFSQSDVLAPQLARRLLIALLEALSDGPAAHGNTSQNQRSEQ